jgi:hypothetical protein
MQTTDPSITPTLLIVGAVILAAMGGIILLLWRISCKLITIEKRLKNLPEMIDSATRTDGPSVAEKSPGGAFESFLNEDPTRWNLPKNEQFAAYRKWRQQKGLNWSVP